MTSRDRLIREIRSDFAQTAAWTGRPAPSAPVVKALSRVAREAFVPDSQVSYAYANTPLPIGFRQTISQPFIVAIMTDALDLPTGGRVLEIGTGSGYQAAVLADLGMRVFSIEVVPELAARARASLDRLGITSVQIRQGDGNGGWPEEAPFDAIMVTAAAPEIPSALLEQLKPGGRMVIPVGPAHADQMLLLIEKTAAGDIRRREVLPVAFVPLVKR
jgi:protein-L-isoaspartate(D-aspartate) O-methyltransferase